VHATTLNTRYIRFWWIKSF